ncbi:UDP-glucuronosyltransferase [Peribacillus cavernae]|uniref:UDP-glucuronosyltransferase n=1 Tax=Peribacillus cavernae TaxID=1674310 RepID=A0A3S0U0U2_9BACI|nr:glycosyltransferase [Peribacillus cavernae]MDQ0220221.1 UDP-N-acetylglucosamine:LPS N-acetylglucosamine transferase [Peribacillus cavernae]RUQ28838.1 UDP-glucuronosyltransferase [Peribacillus cavernae]
MKQRSANKTILFLPFLQIPSGHHQVARALLEGIQKSQPNIICESVDILSYSYGKAESIVSNVYLKWIHSFPGLYSLIYSNTVYKNVNKQKHYRIFELLFLPFIKKLLKQKTPTLIVCTHALPSYMLNCLKEKKELTIPVINVYTDYFIHQLWGIEHIDYHFVSSQEMKDFLQLKGVKEEQIFVTGVPIHNKINKQKEPLMEREASSTLKILIAGGNLGAGLIEKLVKKINYNSEFHYYVLCGTNKKLYDRILKLGNNNITPLHYITCKEQMNELYDHVDAIVTKPGGVTISECLFKRKPIFLYHALPGQEEINMQTLERLGVISHLKGWEEDDKSLEDEIYSFFNDNQQLRTNQNRIAEYHQLVNTKEPAEIIEELLAARS